MNEKSRVKRRFDGKLSEHISSVITEELESDKDAQIEPTINNLNTIGNSTKPFYFINNLQESSFILRVKLLEALLDIFSMKLRKGSSSSLLMVC